MAHKPIWPNTETKCFEINRERFLYHYENIYKHLAVCDHIMTLELSAVSTSAEQNPDDYENTRAAICKLEILKDYLNGPI